MLKTTILHIIRSRLSMSALTCSRHNDSSWFFRRNVFTRIFVHTLTDPKDSAITDMQKHTFKSLPIT